MLIFLSFLWSYVDESGRRTSLRPLVVAEKTASQTECSMKYCLRSTFAATFTFSWRLGSKLSTFARTFLFEVFRVFQTYLIKLLNWNEFHGGRRKTFVYFDSISHSIKLLLFCCNHIYQYVNERCELANLLSACNCIYVIMYRDYNSTTNQTTYVKIEFS